MAAAALVATLVLFGGAARGHEAAALTLDVTFSSNETIAVTLPDGTPVGTASGAPTVIPAGFYTVLETGPMGLPAGLPYFHLSGPKVDLLSNLNEGGLESYTDHVTLQPSSTYTWTDDAISGVVNKFTTTADVLGTAPGAAVSPHTGAPASSQDLVGSDVVRLLGTLTGSVSAAGTLTLAFGGKRPAKLAAGRYRIVVTDKSATAGFILARTGHAAKQVTGVVYIGKRSLVLGLAAGRWHLVGRIGAKTGTTIVVA